MSTIILFEEERVRRAWDKATQKWLFAIVDVIAVLTDSADPAVYWRVMKKRLGDEGSETVTKCNALKMTAADGKQRLTGGDAGRPCESQLIAIPTGLGKTSAANLRT